MPPEANEGREAFARLTGATDEQLADLDSYRELLSAWNVKFNLVGPSTLPVFWMRHAYDCWQLVSVVPDAVRWADLGSGAGLPGVILAIALRRTPGAQVHLVESSAKRCRFLSAVVETLALPAQVHNQRAETASVAVEIVTARACAPLTRLLGFAQPWIARGATGLFMKGEAVDAELIEARREWVFHVEHHPSVSNPAGRLVRIEGLARRGH